MSGLNDRAGGFEQGDRAWAYEQVKKARLKPQTWEDSMTVPELCSLLLDGLYIQKFGAIHPDAEESRKELTSAYRGCLWPDTPLMVARMFEDKPYLYEEVKRESQSNPAFGCGMILFVYYLMGDKHHEAARLWPFTERELRPIFTAMGISHNQY